MPEIKIETPIELEFSVLEIDDKIPSFKIELKMVDSGFKELIQIIKTFWIKNEDWDQFSNGESSELKDISGLWIIRICNNNGDNKNILMLNYSSKSLKSIHTIELKYNLSSEDNFNFFNKIASFPKWW